MATERNTLRSDSTLPDATAARAAQADRLRGQTVAAVFGEAGPLARAIAGYRVRAQQIELAESIAQTIAGDAVLIAEAGTGTGKTIAYLVPALLYGGKTLISTGTKTLQDQLFHRDLPTVRDALGVPAQIALLKGRANYVCLYHLERNLHDGRLPSREAVVDLQAIARFAKRTRSGDRSELAAVPENAPAWALATSTRENCLGQQCPSWSDCFVMRARRDALGADVVVVNHHLFFADAMLRDEGMAELLPTCNTIVLDEAHQLPEAATQFFGESISTGQILDLCRDVLVAQRISAADARELADAVRLTDRAARDLRLSVPLKETRVPLHGVARFAGFTEALDTLANALEQLGRTLERYRERAESLEQAALRAAELALRLARWQSTDDAPGEEAEPSDAERSEAGGPGPLVRWLDVRMQSLALHSSPLDVAAAFRKQVDARRRSWILTSATLAVGEEFRLYQERLGLSDARTALWPSPFDYANNALLYLPRGLPDPAEPDFTDRVVDACLPVLRASRGRAFLLFTTLRAMRRAHAILQERLPAEGLTFPLLVQGEATKTSLLDRFRASGNAILLASASFWEGVDVKGEALSLVVIDKLPFAPPDDPVLAARLQWMTRTGRNAFLEYQVPEAAIALKQGVGRLIRDEADRGVLVICDRRLSTRPYGKRILEALPPMPRTQQLADVEAFFSQA